jgi:hypothetical protein
MYTIVDGTKKYIGDRDDLASLKEGIDGSIVVVDQGDGICWLELPPAGRRKKTRWLSPSRPMSGAHLTLTHSLASEDRAWRIVNVEGGGGDGGGGGGTEGWCQIQWVRDPTLYIQTHSSFLRLDSVGSIWQTDNRLYTMMYGTRRFLTSEDKRPVVRPTAAASYIVNRGHGLVSIETRRPGYSLRFWHTNLVFSGKTVEPEWRLIPQLAGGFLIQSTLDIDLYLTVLPDGDVIRSSIEYAKIWFVGKGDGA